MSQRWKHLQGDKLATFAASPKVLQETPNLIAHIAKHGTVDDFNNVINQHQTPVKYCTHVYRRFPHAAEQWLLNALNAGEALTHYEVVRGVLANDVPKKFLPQINFSVLSDDQLENVFLPLLRHDLKEHIIKNWNVFAPVTRNTSNVNQKVWEAAAKGWDLAALINWSPTSDNRDVYFKCCCQGGLLEQAKRSPVPTTLATVGHAFIETCMKHPKNAEEVLKYLWDTYPNTSWHVFDHILSRVCTVSPTLTEKMVAHFKTHDPQSLTDEARNISCFAAAHGKVDLMHQFLPYVHPTLHHEVVANALECKNKNALNSLLALPGDTLHWGYIWQFSTPWSRQILEEYKNVEQAKLLSTAIAPSTKHAPKRKM